MKAERSSNFELLRIVGMIMIVFYHFSHYGYFGFETYGINAAAADFLILFGKVGVDIFILISGFFLVETNGYKISKTIKLWLQIFSYSILFLVMSIVLKSPTLTVGSYIKSFAPISTEKWWFASTYFVMYLLSPFLNKLLRSLTQKQYISMLILTMVLWSVLAVVFLRTLQFNDLLMFFWIYSVGGYIKLYKNRESVNKRKCSAFLLITVAVAFGTQALCTYFIQLGFLTDFAAKYKEAFTLSNSPFTIIISVLMFLIFKGIKIKNSKLINIISSATFGVYLIHDSDFLRPIIWETIVNGKALKDSPYFIPYSIAACVAVYIVATLVELARIYILEKNYMKLVYRAEPKIKSAIGKIMNPIYKVLQ